MFKTLNQFTVNIVKKSGSPLANLIKYLRRSSMLMFKTEEVRFLPLLIMAESK
jgi:hypothetical protein